FTTPLSSSPSHSQSSLHFFFFNDTATTEIYTLSLHDALPISPSPRLRRLAPPVPVRPPCGHARASRRRRPSLRPAAVPDRSEGRSEEHTSELQSRGHLVCRLLLEKKKTKQKIKYKLHII